jgi:hypothetical protein
MLKFSVDNILYNGSLTNHGYGGLERKQKHLQGIIIDST